MLRNDNSFISINFFNRKSLDKNMKIKLELTGNRVLECLKLKKKCEGRGHPSWAHPFRPQCQFLSYALVTQLVGRYTCDMIDIFSFDRKWNNTLHIYVTQTVMYTCVSPISLNSAMGSSSGGYGGSTLPGKKRINKCDKSTAFYNINQWTISLSNMFHSFTFIVIVYLSEFNIG